MMAEDDRRNMSKIVEAELRRLSRKGGGSIAILREAMIRGVMIGVTYQIVRPEAKWIEIPSVMNPKNKGE